MIFFPGEVKLFWVSLDRYFNLSDLKKKTKSETFLRLPVFSMRTNFLWHCGQKIVIFCYSSPDTSGVARTFLGGWAAHLEDQIEEESGEKLRKNGRNNRRMMKYSTLAHPRFRFWPARHLTIMNKINQSRNPLIWTAIFLHALKCAFGICQLLFYSWHFLSCHYVLLSAVILKVFPSLPNFLTGKTQHSKSFIIVYLYMTILYNSNMSG